MMLEIPGRGSLRIDHIVFDFNGTLAEDGQVTEVVSGLLVEVAQRYTVTIATADTFGSAAGFAERLGLSWLLVTNGHDKETLVRSRGGGVAAVGNGVNDHAMFGVADLAVAVLGPEGAAAQTLHSADIVVPSIERALQLFLHPQRLIATLRE